MITMTLPMKNPRTVTQLAAVTRPSTKSVPERADTRLPPLQYHQCLSPILPPLPRCPSMEVMPHPPLGRRWTFMGHFPTPFPPVTLTHIRSLNPTGRVEQCNMLIHMLRLGIVLLPQNSPDPPVTGTMADTSRNDFAVLDLRTVVHTHKPPASSIACQYFPHACCTNDILLRHGPHPSPIWIPMPGGKIVSNIRQKRWYHKSWDENQLVNLSHARNPRTLRL